MARIGIDLTAVPRLKGGVGVYLTELVAALQRIDRENEYRLIVRDEESAELEPSAPNFVAVPIPLRSRPARLWWEQVGLPRLANRLGLDVLHSPHYTRPLRRLSCASVVGVMDLTFFLLPGRHTLIKRLFFRSMLRASTRKANRLIAISESTKRDLVRCLNVAPSRIDVTPLAVSPAYRSDYSADVVADVRTRHGLGEPYLLFVGTLEPRKNLLRLLDAYETQLKRNPSTPLLALAGVPGWHRKGLDTRLRNLVPKVKVLGYVPEKDLPAIYAGALIFIYPSLYEGFGLPVLEALSSGVPTITSSISSMAEIAAGAAELVDPLSTEKIAAAIEHLLKDSTRRQDLRERGLKRAASFSWDLTARLTRDCYLRAIDEFCATR